MTVNDLRLGPAEDDPRLGPAEDSGFVPAHTPAQAPGSAWDTVKDFGVGTGEGVSLGFDDETVGALHAVGHWLGLSNKTYTQARDAWRARQDQAHTRSPVATGAGQLTGALALGAVTGGAGAEASLAREAAVLSGTGALQGLGGSRAEDTVGLAKDSIGGAVLGLIAGKAVKSLGRDAQITASRLATASRNARLKSTGLSETQVTRAGGPDVASPMLKRAGVFKGGVPGPARMQENARAAIPGAQAAQAAHGETMSASSAVREAERTRLLDLAHAAEASHMEQAPPSAPPVTPPTAPTPPRAPPPGVIPPPVLPRQGPAPDLDADLITLRPPPPGPLADTQLRAPRHGLVGPQGLPFRHRDPLPPVLPRQGRAPDLDADLATLRPPPQATAPPPPPQPETITPGRLKAGVPPVPVRLRKPDELPGQIGRTRVPGSLNRGEPFPAQEAVPTIGQAPPLAQPGVRPPLQPQNPPGEVGRTIQNIPPMRQPSPGAPPAPAPAQAAPLPQGAVPGAIGRTLNQGPKPLDLPEPDPQVTGLEQTMPALPRPGVSAPPAPARPMGAQRQAIPTDAVAQALRDRAGTIPTEPGRNALALQGEHARRTSLLTQIGGTPDSATGELVGGTLANKMYNPSGNGMRGTLGMALSAANAATGHRGGTIKALALEAMAAGAQGTGKALGTVAPAAAQEAALLTEEDPAEHYKQGTTDPLYRQSYLKE